MIYKIFLSFFVLQGISGNLPPHIKVCPKNSSNRDQCLKSAIESLSPFLKSGNISPEVKLSPTIDPIPFGDFTIGKGFKMTMKNFKISDTSPYTVEKLNVNGGKNVKISALLNILKPKGYSDYDLEWKIGPIDIKGSGKQQMMFENLKVYVQMTGVRETRNNIEYVKITNSKAKIQINGIKMKFENLFSGNKALEDASNELINQNGEVLLKEAIPKFEKVLTSLAARMSNQIFSKIPADLLFPN